MKKTIARFFAAPVLFAAACSVMFGAGSAAAQQSDQPCVNSCKQEYRVCADRTDNPGGLNQCRKTYRDCLERCAEL